MRRNMVVAAMLAALVAGCGIFSARTDAVEQAAGQELSAQRLADLMTSIQGPVSYDPKIGEFLTTMWTDVTLFSQAVANNQLKPDSALVAEAMWMPISNVLISRWLDTIVSRRVKITDAELDSNIKADKVRAVQHILVHLDTLAPKEEQAATLKKAQALLARVKGGENFGKIAIANTEDPGSKADSGWYALMPLGNWEKPFGDALRGLKPGEVSGLVKTRFGYHIIRSPSIDESRKIWHDSLARAMSEPISKAYTTEIAAQYHLKLAADASPRMHAALEDLTAHEGDKALLVTFDGGGLTEGRFAHWINSAVSADPGRGPEQLSNLRAAPDSQLNGFVELLAQSEIMLAEAAKNKVRVTPEEWKQMIQGFTAQIDTIRASIGLTDAVLDPKASTSDRSKAAAEKVDQYFNNVVAMKTPPRALPGALSAVLRGRMKTKFNGVALQRAVDLAKTKHAADSTKAAASGAPPTNDGTVKPSAGGPPVGGAGDPGKGPGKP